MRSCFPKRLSCILFRHSARAISVLTSKCLSNYLIHIALIISGAGDSVQVNNEILVKFA